MKERSGIGESHDWRDPTLWDPLRRTVLGEARKALAMADPLILTEWLDHQLGRGWWRASITARLAIAVAHYRLEHTPEAHADFDAIAREWRATIDADPDLADAPLDLLFLTHELLLFAQRSHREVPMREAALRVRRTYDAWRTEGRLDPAEEGADPLLFFARGCLAACDARPRGADSVLPELTPAP